MINRYGDYQKLKDIASVYKIARTTVSNIINGYKFKNENLDYTPVRKRQAKKPSQKLSFYTKEELKIILIKNNNNISKMSKQLNIPRKPLSDYLQKHALSPASVN